MTTHTTAELAQLRADMQYLACSNHGCVFRTERGGVGTNGLCHCLDGLDPQTRRLVARMATFIKALPTDQNA